MNLNNFDTDKVFDYENGYYATAAEARFGTFPGETKAVDDFLANKGLTVQKLSISHIPSFVIKQ